jgi:hypothetical protein
VVRVKKLEIFHKQIPVELSDGRIITCDEKMAPLIYALNEAGLITIFSCQGGKMPGYETKKLYDYKAHLILDLRSISSVKIDGNYLKLDWVLNNPKKNFKQLKSLTKLRRKCLNEYNFEKKVNLK